MKAKAKFQFLGYQKAADGELVRVSKPHEDVDFSLSPALTLSGYENGIPQARSWLEIYRYARTNCMIS